MRNPTRTPNQTPPSVRISYNVAVQETSIWERRGDRQRLPARNDIPDNALQGMFPYRPRYLRNPIRRFRLCLISTTTEPYRCPD
jgi:hypothetical protein